MDVMGAFYIDDLETLLKKLVGLVWEVIRDPLLRSRV